ncbi:MAG: ribosomal protein methylthiotransferase [Clostridia bacterium]|nr:ribosomal protein methylthiotransferase [Clostridia bacterium]
MGIRVAVVTLGCAKNQVDTEYMLGVLSEAGYELCNEPDKAEVVIVNTCSFITAAKEEALETVLNLAEQGKERKIIVAGCLAQQHARELVAELPEASAFVGPGAIPELPDIVARVLRGERLVRIPAGPALLPQGLPRVRISSGPVAYLKIAEGCNNRCTYCTIPSIKGPFASRPMESILTEARFLCRRGARELVLVAQDTTAYGLDLYGAYRLPELLRRLAALPVDWLRLLYAYPTRLTPELQEVMAGEPKVCAYLDLPLQHVHPDILRLMGRGGTLGIAVESIARLRKLLPDIALRSTFIVGFPGEKEEHFQRLLDFMTEIAFDWVGIFTYSPEEGTPAAGLPEQVPEEVKEERYHRAMMLQREITYRKNQSWVGREVKVLIEERKESEEPLAIGRSFRQAPEVDGVIYISGSGVPGEFKRVLLKEVVDVYDLAGEEV